MGTTPRPPQVLHIPFEPGQARHLIVFMVWTGSRARNPDESAPDTAIRRSTVPAPSHTRQFPLPSQAGHFTRVAGSTAAVAIGGAPPADATPGRTRCATHSTGRCTHRPSTLIATPRCR